MDLSKEEKNNLIRKLLFSRTRVLAKYGFLGLLLMHMKMALDESIETAATDAEYIYFSPKFLNELSDNELDFILMHEILHVVLKHCFRDGDRIPELFNIACDIVINSIILQEHGFDLKSITLDKYGTSMHIAPDGKEGCNYTAEEVYEMLEKKMSNKGMKGKNGSDNNSQGSSSSSNSSDSDGDTGGTSNSKTIDDHSKWKEKSGETKDKEVEWDNRVYEAIKAIERQNEASGAGNMPAYMERIINKLTTPQIDWRYVLNEFIQEEINDYTFLPPDYRYSGDFFLPSYSDKDDIVKNVLFMIDTSGSMTNEMITYAFSEVYGAIAMFDGKLSGKLGFFDYVVHNVVDFNDVSDIVKIKPMGGGGTSFESVFEYVDRMDEPPVMIIILTDGQAPYPKLDSSYNIPILWLINNDLITPPYGKVARIKITK